MPPKKTISKTKQSTTKSKAKKPVAKKTTRKVQSKGKVTDCDVKKKAEWQLTHARIEEAYVKLIADNSLRPPTQAEVAKIAGVSRETVNRHFEDLDISFYKDHPLKVLTPKVIMNTFVSSRKSPASQKLWFQYFGLLEEDNKQKLDIDIHVKLPDELEDVD